MLSLSFWQSSHSTTWSSSRTKRLSLCIIRIWFLTLTVTSRFWWDSTQVVLLFHMFYCTTLLLSPNQPVEPHLEKPWTRFLFGKSKHVHLWSLTLHFLSFHWPLWSRRPGSDPYTPSRSSSLSSSCRPYCRKEQELPSKHIELLQEGSWMNEFVEYFWVSGR